MFTCITELSESSSSMFRLRFLRNIAFLNLQFSIAFGRNLIPECAYRPWNHLRFFVKMNIHGKSQVDSWYFGFVSFSLSLFILSNLSLVTSPSPGPHGGGGPRRCRRPRPLGGRPQAPRRQRLPLGGRPRAQGGAGPFAAHRP